MQKDASRGEQRALEARLKQARIPSLMKIADDQARGLQKKYGGRFASTHTRNDILLTRMMDTQTLSLDRVAAKSSADLSAETTTALLRRLEPIAGRGPPGGSGSPSGTTSGSVGDGTRGSGTHGGGSRVEAQPAPGAKIAGLQPTRQARNPARTKRTRPSGVLPSSRRLHCLTQAKRPDSLPVLSSRAAMPPCAAAMPLSEPLASGVAGNASTATAEAVPETGGDTGSNNGGAMVLLAQRGLHRWGRFVVVRVQRGAPDSAEPAKHIAPVCVDVFDPEDPNGWVVSALEVSPSQVEVAIGAGDVADSSALLDALLDYIRLQEVRAAFPLSVVVVVVVVVVIVVVVVCVCVYVCVCVELDSYVEKEA